MYVKNISLFESSNDYSYKCSAKTSFTFGIMNSISFKDVQVQPYDVASNGEFSTGKNSDGISLVVHGIILSVKAFC